MKSLNNRWESYTYEFSPLQRGVIAAILAIIFFIAMVAVVLLAREVITG